jgi:hypothetical protein
MTNFLFLALSALSVMGIMSANLSEYDEERSSEFWFYTAASYCRSSKIESWTCGKACSLPALEDIRVFYNRTG